MRIAIMQPYFLPYLGYWQLIASVDRFVVLDSVSYIKGGWVNRNRIDVNGQPSWLTVPLVGASSNRRICDIDIKKDDGWRTKLHRKVVLNYTRAPHTQNTLPWFESILEEAFGNLSDYLAGTIESLCNRFCLKTEIIPSSRPYEKDDLRGSDRVLDLCRRLGATTYVNLPGGKDLYCTNKFAEFGIGLEFLENQHSGIRLESGVVGGESFSILHLMMHNSTEMLSETIRNYRTETPISGRLRAA